MGSPSSPGSSQGGVISSGRSRGRPISRGRPFGTRTRGAGSKRVSRHPSRYSTSDDSEETADDVSSEETDLLENTQPLKGLLDHNQDKRSRYKRLTGSDHHKGSARGSIPEVFTSFPYPFEILEDLDDGESGLQVYETLDSGKKIYKGLCNREWKALCTQLKVCITYVEHCFIFETSQH